MSLRSAVDRKRTSVRESDNGFDLRNRPWRAPQPAHRVKPPRSSTGEFGNGSLSLTRQSLQEEVHNLDPDWVSADTFGGERTRLGVDFADGSSREVIVSEMSSFRRNEFHHRKELLTREYPDSRSDPSRIWQRRVRPERDGTEGSECVRSEQSPRSECHQYILI